MRSATVSMDLTWASTPGVGRESRQRTRNYEDANIIALGTAACFRRTSPLRSATVPAFLRALFSSSTPCRCARCQTAAAGPPYSAH